MARPRFDYSQLTADERIELAEELWNSLSETPTAISMTDAQAEELDRRIEAYRKDRNPGIPWREALKKIDESGA